MFLRDSKANEPRERARKSHPARKKARRVSSRETIFARARQKKQQQHKLFASQNNIVVFQLNQVKKAAEEDNLPHIGLQNTS